MTDVLPVEDELLVRDVVDDVLSGSGLGLVAPGTAEAALRALGGRRKASRCW
jgi:CheY-like chemotaxis protein